MLIRWKTVTAPPSLPLLVGLIACLLLQTAEASLGDRLPEFRECVEVRDALARPLPSARRVRPFRQPALVREASLTYR